MGSLPATRLRQPPAPSTSPRRLSDLELRYRPPDEIDLARLEQWARQLSVDARASDTGGAYGDLATMEWTRDRVTDGIDATDLTRINFSLLAMRDALIDKDLAAAGEEASKLQDTLAAPLN